jgi:hypothetical protein
MKAKVDLVCSCGASFEYESIDHVDVKFVAQKFLENHKNCQPNPVRLKNILEDDPAGKEQLVREMEKVFGIMRRAC